MISVVLGLARCGICGSTLTCENEPETINHNDPNVRSVRIMIPVFSCTSPNCGFRYSDWRSEILRSEALTNVHSESKY